MRKFLKISGIAIGVLLLLIVVAAIALPLLVDPNDFKPRIITAVEDATGRNLEIPGEIELSLFPWLGVEMGTVRLGNAEGFGEKPFASIAALQVRVKLLPLLQKRIEIGKVVVDQPVIRLSRKANGETNWQDLATAGETAEEPAPKTGEGGQISPPDLSVEGIEIRDANIIYSDAVAKSQAQLADFNLEAGSVRLPADFPVTMSGRIVLSEPAVEGRFEFKGQVSANLDEQLYSLAESRLTFDAKGEALPVSPLAGQLSWQNITANMAAGTAGIQALAAQVLGVDVSIGMQASGLNETPVAKGDLRVKEFSPGQLLVKLGQELPATRDGEVLDTFSLSAGFEATPDSVLVDSLQVTLDQTGITGRVEVASFEKRRLRFDLAVDQLDVDRYLPATDAGEEPSADAAPLDEIEIPAELVRGRDIVGEMTIGKLKAFGFNSTDVRMGVTAQNDRLRIHPAEASFYGGGYRGDIRINASGEVPVIAVNEHIETVQLAPMVKDVLEVENISGSANMAVKATATGGTVGAMRETLDGSFSVDVSDGALEGFNVWESIREAYAKLKGREYESTAPDRTEFAELSATGRIRQGILSNDDLVAKLPFLRIAGSGEIDIAAATMDYMLEATVLKSPELSGGIEELADVAIPVSLSGPITSPKIRPDVKGVLEAKAREALDRKKQELREEAERKEQELRDEAKQKAEEEKERLEDKLKNKLKDFFG